MQNPAPEVLEALLPANWIKTRLAANRVIEIPAAKKPEMRDLSQKIQRTSVDRLRSIAGGPGSNSSTRHEQQKTWQRNTGISPKEAQSPVWCFKNWVQQYVEIWGKPPPGVPLTPEEFAAREPLWNAKVLNQQEAAKR